MNRITKTCSLIVLTILVFTLGCGDSGGDDDPGTADNFDRAGMLAHWADNIILPSYDRYFERLGALQTATNSFVAEPSMQGLINLRAGYVAAYKAWQAVSMFEIGPAETLTLRNFTNIFPADTQEIEENVASGTANLVLPSTNDSQGFPALDFMLYGLAPDEAAILTKLSESNYQNYLTALVDRLWNLADEVRREWRTEGYRDVFVSASGSSATSSVNKLVNDFMFYYEKSLRAGKVGIPAGVFSGTPISDRAEAPFHGALSKELLLEAIGITQDFFRGAQFGSTASGPGLEQYLDELNVRKDAVLLSQSINAQLVAAQDAAQRLNDDLKTQVEDDNALMLAAYDELQKAVVLLKVDMFQALNIQVDFVDADGD